MEYIKRYIDDELVKYLNAMGAVLIEGPKWIGKTTSALQQSNSVLELQNPDNLESNLELASIKPSLLLEGEKPRLIDEWQIAPVLWDAVRASVDKISKPGQYLLTGSNTVDDNEIMHSGTGRIHRLEMLPMSLFESGDSNGKIKIMDLFDNPHMDIDGIESQLTIEDLVFVMCRGGWPETLKLKDRQSQLITAKSYVESICRSDASTIDGVKRNPERIKMVLRSYSRNIGTLASDKTLIDDIKSQFGDVSKPTFNSYVDALKQLFVIKNIPSWSPNIRSKTAIRSKNKLGFCDPSIATATLNLTPEKLIFDLDTAGHIFETLCSRDLLVYSCNHGGRLSYYRDRFGLEADGVLELDDGRYCLLEFKIGSKHIDDASINLNKLKSLLEENGYNSPTFLAVITAGKYAYTREDGVKILPIGCLS